MKNHGSHPGRSADFLSRLYDGELTAAERAHFESHRSHCAECRSAASDFEGALSFFRSSRPSPPSPDLAQRILRKLQASTPRRAPFGVFFGINLKWAGAFAAALIATIIGSSIVLKQEAPKSTVANAPIPVVVQEKKKEKDESEIGKSAPAPVVARFRAPAKLPAEPASNVKDRDKASAFDATLPQARENLARPEPKDQTRVKTDDFKAAAEEPLRRGYVAEGRAEAPAAPAGAAGRPVEARAQRQSRAQERPGGEGAVQGQGVVAFADQAAPAPPRLIISSIDGRGTTPELSDEEKPQAMADLRGREYVLTVNSQGRVTAVRPRGGRRAAPRPDLGTERAAQEAQAPPALMNLRFKPTDHPRLLLVRIE